MKRRILARVVQSAVKSFPAVVVTGPRQSGKTTLLRTQLRRTHRYINLEDPDVRIRATDDPRTFLAGCTGPVILDEFQYAPQLLPYIKSRIDDKRKPGYWILTGSQNFVMMQDVGESLAGRTAVLSLPPFSYAERVDRGGESVSMSGLLKRLSRVKPFTARRPPLAQLILRGHYPEIASRPSINKDLWCGSYITTYLERDIRNLSQVGDLGQFERFLRLCATRTGQILNVSDLARDIGVSVPTARRWLSMLETGYQVVLLYPYYRNLGKRLVKSPKLYFNDTALACYLLGLRDSETLLGSPHFPHLFETFIVMDFWKRCHVFGHLPSMYYLRTRDGLEVDLVVEMDGRIHLFEIKSGATMVPKHAASLVRARNDFGKAIGISGVISRGPEVFEIQRGVQCWPWQDVLSL